MGWLFYTDGRVQNYADEKAEIARLCTCHGDTRKTELVKACKVGSTWYAAAKITNLDGTPVEDTTYVTDADGSITFAAVFLTRYDDGCWGYKDMEESAGPVESRAPLSLLAPAVRAERPRQLCSCLAPALPGLGCDPGLRGRRQDQARHPCDAHRWQYLPDCHRDPLQAWAAKAPLLPHRGNWWARTPVEGLACGLGAAQLREGGGQPGAGRVPGGAETLEDQCQVDPGDRSQNSQMVNQ